MSDLFTSALQGFLKGTNNAGDIMRREAKEAEEQRRYDTELGMKERRLSSELTSAEQVREARAFDLGRARTKAEREDADFTDPLNVEKRELDKKTALYQSKMTEAITSVKSSTLFDEEGGDGLLATVSQTFSDTIKGAGMDSFLNTLTEVEAKLFNSGITVKNGFTESEVSDYKSLLILDDLKTAGTTASSGGTKSSTASTKVGSELLNVQEYITGLQTEMNKEGIDPARLEALKKMEQDGISLQRKLLRQGLTGTATLTSLDPVRMWIHRVEQRKANQSIADAKAKAKVKQRREQEQRTARLNEERDKLEAMQRGAGSPSGGMKITMGSDGGSSGISSQMSIPTNVTTNPADFNRMFLGGEQPKATPQKKTRKLSVETVR